MLLIRLIHNCSEGWRVTSESAVAGHLVVASSSSCMVFIFRLGSVTCLRWGYCLPDTHRSCVCMCVCVSDAFTFGDRSLMCFASFTQLNPCTTAIANCFLFIHAAKGKFVNLRSKDVSAYLSVIFRRCCCSD